MTANKTKLLHLTSNRKFLFLGFETLQFSSTEIMVCKNLKTLKIERFVKTLKPNNELRFFKII
jgi:hypothetical protein